MMHINHSPANPRQLSTPQDNIHWRRKIFSRYTFGKPAKKCLPPGKNVALNIDKFKCLS